jgi:hypothetical protein
VAAARLSVFKTIRFGPLGAGAVSAGGGRGGGAGAALAFFDFATGGFAASSTEGFSLTVFLLLAVMIP